VKENTNMIDKLLLELKEQSKEIGRLEAEISHLREQLAEKNAMLQATQGDAACVVAS
jgi:chromosome segregation ATPase